MTFVLQTGARKGRDSIEAGPNQPVWEYLGTEDRFQHQYVGAGNKAVS